MLKSQLPRANLKLEKLRLIYDSKTKGRHLYRVQGNVGKERGFTTSVGGNALQVTRVT